jgi:predicted nucleic acid-binding protein
MVVFDTNVIIDFLNGSKTAGAAFEKYRGNGVAITSITCYELIKGVGEPQRDLLQSLFDNVKIYDIDLKSAWLAGEMHRRLKTSGSLLSEADLLIVSAAFANGEIFVTQDRDFAKLNDRRIIIVKE